MWLILLTSLLPVARAQFEYTTNAGTITIIRYTGPGGDVSIPDAFDGIAVTAIGQNAFYSCTTLTNVVVPDSVTNIGNTAFVDCSSLTNATLGKGVAAIGYHAFFSCSSLVSFTVDSQNAAFCSVDGVLFDKDQTTLILCPARRAGHYSVPEGVTCIADGAFDHCISLTSAAIPNSVTNIMSGAFYACTSLASVALGTNVTTIGNLAFYGCTSLPHVTIPNSVTSLYGAFSDCTSLASVTLGNSVTNIGGSFVRCRRLGSVTIPSSVTVIGGMAFAGCSSLTNVVIPGTVTRIEGAAFSACGSLSAIAVPDGVSSLGAYTFEYCTNLAGFTIPTALGVLERYVFQHCPSLGGMLIPDNVTNIQWAAFVGCSGLAEIQVGKGVNLIEDWAFSACSSLTAITVNPENAHYSSVDGVLFDKGRATLIKYPEGKVGSYKVPGTVTTIRSYSFQDTKGLTGLVIPAGISSLGSQAFYGCANLTAVSFEGDAPAADSSVFGGNNMATVYYFPNTANWEATLGGRPTALWNPEMPTGAPDFGVQPDGFGFAITGSTNLVLVVEACTNLSGGSWFPVTTNTLTEGVSLFSDREWTNFAGRFYRLRSP